MFIQTETTPNPLTLKFLPGQTVMETGTAFFTNEEDAATSPMAKTLFAIDGVSAVFLGGDFITITREEDFSWEVLKPILLTAMMDQFVSGAPIVEEKTAANVALNDSSTVDDDALSKQIRELIDTRVRPAVAQDGGDIIFKGFEDGVVKLELHGACSGCPSSTATLKNGIENMLKHYVPEVVAVEAVM